MSLNNNMIYLSDKYPIDYEILIDKQVWKNTLIGGSKWWELYNSNLDLKFDVPCLDYDQNHCRKYIEISIFGGTLCKIINFPKSGKKNLQLGVLKTQYPDLIRLIYLSKIIYRELTFDHRFELVLKVWTYDNLRYL